MISMTRILLDAGHGAGKAHNRGSLVGNEGDNNFRYSLLLKKELERYEGVRVDLTRVNINDNPTLAERGKMAKGCDLLLSLHSNAFNNSNVRGTEIFDSVARKNKALAESLVVGIAKLFNHPNRGVKYKELSKGVDYYGVLRASLAKSSMLIEHGFHTNKQDIEFWVNNMDKVARFTAQTIAKHYKLVLKENKTNLYRVQTGAFAKKANADNLAKELNKKGFDTYIVLVNKLYKVQVGAYSIKDNAYKMSTKLKKAGYDNFITTNEQTTTVEPKKIQVGSVVRIEQGAKSYTGQSVASFVYKNNYRVDELKGDRAVLDKQGIHTAFNVKDLEIV